MLRRLLFRLRDFSLTRCQRGEPFSVLFPDFPGAVTTAPSIEQAMPIATSSAVARAERLRGLPYEIRTGESVRELSA